MTANRKRLPGAKVLRLFVAGASIFQIACAFNSDEFAVESALRWQIVRVTK